MKKALMAIALLATGIFAGAACSASAQPKSTGPSYQTVTGSLADAYGKVIRYCLSRGAIGIYVTGNGSNTAPYSIEVVRDDVNCYGQ